MEAQKDDKSQTKDLLKTYKDTEAQSSSFKMLKLVTDYVLVLLFAAKIFMGLRYQFKVNIPGRPEEKYLFAETEEEKKE